MTSAPTTPGLSDNALPLLSNCNWSSVAMPRGPSLHALLLFVRKLRPAFSTTPCCGGSRGFRPSHQRGSVAGNLEKIAVMGKVPD